MSFVGNILGSVASAVVQSDSARKAQHAQEDASREAVARQDRQYDLAREDQRPYREVGVQALGQYQSELNKPITSADVMSDPGYQFGLDQGQQGLDRKFAASGGRISGASLKAASRFNTGYATTGYGAAYQRGQDRLNRLSQLASLGQTSVQAGSALGQQQTQNSTNLITGQGNATAAGRLAQGNIWGNGINQIAALYGRGTGGGSSLGSAGSLVNGGGFQNMPAYLIQGD